MSSIYMGLTREPEISSSVYRSCRHVHPSNGDGEYLIDPTSSGNPFTVYCDMTTDGGGWTAIRLILFTELNLRFEDTSYGFKGLSNYRDHRQELSSTDLLQIRNKISFNQLRFYCQKKKVGTVFHIMTNINPLGEAVVRRFIDDNLALTRPQACDLYTVLPDDNSTMSKDCSKWGWNGNHADEKWAIYSATGSHRIQQAVNRREDYHRFFSVPRQRDCDDWGSGEDSLSAGDTWGIFVR
ncbi:hypothetical protein ACROYT_G016413 [Oculina patagonica]